MGAPVDVRMAVVCRAVVHAIQRHLSDVLWHKLAIVPQLAAHATTVITTVSLTDREILKFWV